VPLALSILLFIALAPAAEAGHRHAKKHRKHKRQTHVVHQVRVAPQRPFVVAPPPRIVRYETVRLRPVFVGDTWFAPHRHAHALYDLPVRTIDGYAYRRAAYCSADRSVSGRVTYDGPRFRVAVGF